MSILARASAPSLEAACVRLAPLPEIQWLRRPETGLMMVRGRIGGTGAKFNVGEVPVTRCTVRLADSAGTVHTTGTAWVQGRDQRHAELAARLDAMLQQPDHHDAVRQTVIEPLERAQAGARALRSRKAASTTVEFYTLARGEDQ